MEVSARVNGTEIEPSVAMKGPAARVEWEFKVPVRRGWNELELRAAEADWREIAFPRIQIAPHRIPPQDRTP